MGHGYRHLPIHRMENQCSDSPGIFGYRLSLPDLSIAHHEVFVGGEFGQGHWAACMEFLGADAYLGPEAELGAIGEGGRGIDVDAGGIDLELELADAGGVFADDAFAVARAEAGDVLQGFVEGGHGADAHLIVEKLGAEVAFGGGTEKIIGVIVLELLVGQGVGIEGDVALLELPTQAGQVCQTALMDDETVERIAHTHPAGLGIVDDACPFLYIAKFIEIGVADARSGLDDWDAGVGTYILDEGTAATRDDQIDQTRSGEQDLRRFVTGGQEDAAIGIDLELTQDEVDDVDQRLIGSLCIGAALEHTHIAALETEREDIAGDIGTRLVDDGNHPKRHAYLLNGESVGTLVFCQDLAQWRGQGSYIAHVRRYIGDALGREFQTVVFRIGRVHAPEVGAIGLEYLIGMLLEGIGQGEEHVVYLSGSEFLKLANGTSGRCQALLCIFHI